MNSIIKLPNSVIANHGKTWYVIVKLKGKTYFAETEGQQYPAWQRTAIGYQIHNLNMLKAKAWS